MSWAAPLLFLDGFAGPGRYVNGEPGSPIIALEVAKTHKVKLSKELTFLFIEDRKDRADNLKKEIEALKCPANFNADVKCDDFAKTVTAKLDGLAKGGQKLPPTFAMIDPFGFKGIPFGLMNRLLDNTSCELFVSFMVDSFNRWLTHPGDEIRGHTREAFGNDDPFAIAEIASDRVAALTDLYAKRLRTIAQFVRSFELRDANDRVVYHVFFASNNAKGHEKMKEAMWKVAPLGDFSFSDATNPHQQVFFQKAYQDILKTDLLIRFAKKKNVLIEYIERYVIDDTAFLPKHMREVLRVLEADDKITVGETKSDGKPRRKGSYPNEAYLTFL
jgi:three-Cys-motif partner protein